MDGNLSPTGRDWRRASRRRQQAYSRVIVASMAMLCAGLSCPGQILPKKVEASSSRPFSPLLCPPVALVWYYLHLPNPSQRESSYRVIESRSPLPDQVLRVAEYVPA